MRSTTHPFAFIAVLTLSACNACSQSDQTTINGNVVDLNDTAESCFNAGMGAKDTQYWALYVVSEDGTHTGSEIVQSKVINKEDDIAETLNSSGMIEYAEYDPYGPSVSYLGTGFIKSNGEIKKTRFEPTIDYFYFRPRGFEEDHGTITALDADNNIEAVLTLKSKYQGKELLTVNGHLVKACKFETYGSKMDEDGISQSFRQTTWYADSYGMRLKSSITERGSTTTVSAIEAEWNGIRL
ncbi:hypothetical protein [Veronia nyctiphanis]|uniref:hypothetical protein n=1 Tax=Veronia nyctiphanis TaxID=1278244 RepID=UPI00191C4A9A|nr:hypothetical protein [Veronia nyctiphanis]